MLFCFLHKRHTPVRKRGFHLPASPAAGSECPLRIHGDVSPWQQLLAGRLSWWRAFVGALLKRITAVWLSICLPCRWDLRIPELPTTAQVVQSARLHKAHNTQRRREIRLPAPGSNRLQQMLQERGATQLRSGCIRPMAMEG